MESDLNEYNSFYQCSKIHQLLVLRGGEESQEDNLKITSDEIFPKAWICIWISHVLDSQSWCDSKVLKLSNLLNMGWTTKKPCTDNENSTKNWKNQLDFIWKDFDSRTWRNKSHLILRCISWKSIKNKFPQSTIKS